MASGGFGSSRSFALRVSAGLDTCSTPRFTLADLQVGLGLRALSFCVGRCRGMCRVIQKA
ncbi:hypothetical protein IHE45_07G059300 [Dioscorea alata]|uniref:Uncharacterized protein n=1 Tax=Dioscorea alata TaxID=55571 RepID=A0ACB7VRR5_DIOAL|nr:hypothetical protein IHE45_07G059300 [Dioscorea alata]